MSSEKAKPAKSDLNDLAVPTKEGDAVRGGGVKKVLGNTVKNLEAEDRMGNFEVQN